MRGRGRAGTRQGGPGGVGGDVPAEVAPKERRLRVRRRRRRIRAVVVRRVRLLGRCRVGAAAAAAAAAGGGRSGPEPAVGLEGDGKAAEEGRGGEAAQWLAEELVGAFDARSVARGVGDAPEAPCVGGTAATDPGRH